MILAFFIIATCSHNLERVCQDKLSCYRQVLNNAKDKEDLIVRADHLLDEAITYKLENELLEELRQRLQNPFLEMLKIKQKARKKRFEKWLRKQR